jgi:hypothetical protein
MPNAVNYLQRRIIMSGSARSLQSLDFGGLRVSRTFFTPEYSKNGENISAKLEINCYVNQPGKTKQMIKMTAWGKLAHSCAKSMSEGKEFSAFNCELNVYDKRIFMPSLVAGQPGVQIDKPDGSPLTMKAQSYTIGKLGYGMESEKHVAREIAAKTRPIGWNVIGSVEAAQWTEMLKARQAIQFDPNSPTGTYGWAEIRMPAGPGIGAYIPKAAVGMVAAAPIAAPVVAPVAATVAAPIVAQPIVAPVVAAPVIAAGGFVVPTPGV